MRIKILNKAKEDLRNGREFYDAQERGLGAYFMSVMVSEIDALAWCAGLHVMHRDFHKAVVRKFPYSIYYKMEGDVVKVFAVLDNRRDPSWVEERLYR